MRRIRASQLLVAISIATSADFNTSFAVASPHIAGANVSSYDELKKAVEAGTAPILITSERIVFPTQLLIENTTLTIESIPESHTAFRAYLDGGGVTRLFDLQNSSMSLRSLHIEFGSCDDCSGGAVACFLINKK